MRKHYSAINFKVGILILALILLILSIGCSSKIDRPRYKKMYQTARAIDKAISDNEGFLKFKELFLNYSAEVSGAKDAIRSEQEKELFAVYSELFDVYQDCYLLWEYKIQSLIYGWIPEGRIYLEPKIKYIAEKYKLPKQSHILELTNHHWESVSADSVQVIWKEAHKKFQKVKRKNLFYFIFP